MSELSQYACSPVREDEQALAPEELERLLPLIPSWAIIQERGVRKLRAAFTFHDAEQATKFERLVRQQAVEEQHPVEVEPDSEQNRVVVTCYTPAIDGLHPNDFIMAARADGMWSQVLVGRTGEMKTDQKLPRIEEAPRFRDMFRDRHVRGHT